MPAPPPPIAAAPAAALNPAAEGNIDCGRFGAGTLPASLLLPLAVALLFNPPATELEPEGGAPREFLMAERAAKRSSSDSCGRTGEAGKEGIELELFELVETPKILSFGTLSEKKGRQVPKKHKS